MPDKPVIDLSVLDALIAQLGETGEELRLTLLDSYLGEGAVRMVDFHAAVERNDTAAIQRITHAMKSSSTLLGIFPLADLLQQTEDASRDPMTDVRPLAAQVQDEYARAATVIGLLLGRLLEDDSASTHGARP